jgi:hypothetical protein
VSTPALLTRPILISFAAVLFLFTFAASAQNTIYVPTDQTTIQGAINIANNGDTVLVAPGTYTENINFNGKAITVTSSGGAAVTTIDGGAIASVVTFTSGEGLGSVLNGFTIQNGRGGYDGGGIYIASASPTITNNTIQNNAGCDGGGMVVNFSSALVQGNTIQNNNDSVCSGGNGAGIYVGGAGSAQIVGNVIQNNAATHAGNGGGLVLFAAGTPTIRNNTIAGNTTGGVSPASQGGGIWIVNYSDALIVQNLIYNNTAGQGSGIYFGVPSGDRGPILVNNTIEGAFSNSNPGSAVYATGFDSQVQFFNNIIVSPWGPNAVYCDGLYVQQPPSFSNNDAYTANGTGFDGTCAGQAGQNGNISVVPQFVNDTAGNFQLQYNSPAIDAGTNSAPNLAQTDLGGNPRILDGNNNCVSTVDMGVYELVKAANAGFSLGGLTFPNQVIGNASSAQPVTLTNSGATCFQFSSIGVTGDFSQANNCSGGVRGGSSCVFNVTFTPTAIGARLGTLTVTGSDGVTTKTPNVSLSGTGVDFSVVATPTAATVKHAKSAQFNVNVGPVAGADSSAVTLSCSGLPTAAGCSFSPLSVIPGSSGANSALTLSTSGNTPRGTFNLQIVGTSGSTQHSATVQLTVN